MQITGLTDEHRPLFLACLEDWSRDMTDAGDRKEHWCSAMEDRGLGVKLALDEDGSTCGLIQYVPAEHSHIEGKGLYFIQCIWVHGHREGVGNRQRRGMGRALLQAAEEDARSRGAKGMAAWGLSLPFWMPASFYRRHGYSKADRDGLAVLVWKPFAEGAVKPRWIRQVKKPQPVKDKVAVACFVSGWCQGQNIVYERAKRAAAAFGDSVAFTEIDTSIRENLLEWGLSDALFIDGKQVRTGPPLSYEKIRSLVEKRVRKLKRRA